MTQSNHLHAKTTGPVGYRLRDPLPPVRIRRGALWITRKSDPLRTPRGMMLAFAFALALWALVAAGYLILH